MASAAEEDLDLDNFNDLNDDLPPTPLSKAEEEEELAQINEMIANGDRALIKVGIDPYDPDQTRYLDDLNARLVRPANEEKALDDAAYSELMKDLAKGFPNPRKRAVKASSRPYTPKKGGSRRRARSRGNRRKSRRTRRRTRRSTRRRSRK